MRAHNADSLTYAHTQTHFTYTPTSRTQVGAAALASDGRVFLGVNVEFAHATLDSAIHAEQFAISNAALHGAVRLTMLCATASPCGHCRQFCKELNGSKELLVVFARGEPKRPMRSLLDDLLPFGFGPSDLGIVERTLLAHRTVASTEIVSVDSTPADATLAPALRDAALDALRQSYAPYSHSHAGCAIQFRNATTTTTTTTTSATTFSSTTIVIGYEIESCAYNPTMSATRVALAALLMRGAQWRDIEIVVLAENDQSIVRLMKVAQEL